ncbi:MULTISPECIES: hypothetical protein [Kocuria]|jgi:hypothetical protein|uniref:hypothetical protein n=1 Tax=Kocuria TaxID=57493 RepID=UPI000F711683|nr:MULTISPECIES: hypothetical protein [Kocuria]MCM3484791.1 hypothetical protein [Kocuria rosea]NVC22103.1 hypothetical protein [Kocuria salina]WJZ66254.1 hypothetical protein QR564_16155 [Kocuria rosea]VEH41745.1 Uncharacterised protein [Kocuria rosea]
MSPTTSRSTRALGAAAAALLLLASCGTPSGGDPSAEGTSPAASPAATAAESPTATEPATEPATESPSPTAENPTAGPTEAPTSTPTASPTASPTGAPAELVTYSGTAADAAFAFELPATWSVDGDFSDVGGTVTVLGPDGAPVGHLSVLIAWGAECGPDCSMPPVAHLGDVPGSVPLSSSGEFVVRSVAMDLTSSPELRNAYGWPDAVRLVTSLTDADAPPPTTMLPHVLYGLGLVETGVVAPNGITYRTVIFSSVHDFPTLEAAREYAGSEQHRQVEAMIASFRA